MNAYSPDPHPTLSPLPSLTPHYVQRRHLSPSQGLRLPALIRPPALLATDHPARRVLSAPAPAEVLPLETLLLVLLLLGLGLGRLCLRLILLLPLRRLVLLLLRRGLRSPRATLL